MSNGGAMGRLGGVEGGGVTDKAWAGCDATESNDTCRHWPETDSHVHMQTLAWESWPGAVFLTGHMISLQI